MRRRAISGAALAALLVAGACTDYGGERSGPFANPQLVAPPVAPPPVALPPSDASRALAIYYQRLQNDLLARGLLRRDGGGPDTPFTDTMLARNFVKIALFDEYHSDGDLIRAQATVAALRRWEMPIRMTVETGPSVPPARAASDRAEVAAFAARLSRLTGVPISQTAAGGNFHVFFINEDERRALGPRLRALAPGIAESSVRAITDLPRDQLCIVIAFASGAGSSYGQAIAVVRAEHPDLMRLACIHEELAQGMGLANDSPQARPSIFNDDEEFGLLTTHDELLLRMLYDPRLRTGMSAAEAAPIARVIAAEMLGGTT